MASLPLPLGTVLQNRYRLTKTIGRGGFGRTYLAADSARFDEPCVLKEYCPNDTDPYVLQKSQELFQREASILYQIQHPQIPHFHATFEQQKRLFLVQDFIQGKSYRDLLDERMAKQETFSPHEVALFLQQILPALNYIHQKGIVHRDISPDNIILRDSDRLPVLIDFGAVKSGIVPSDTEAGIQGTTVGKLGYSPPEQLQTGEVSPNSDLYALAVTAVVLMTGRKPQELLDQSTMTWRWQQWVPTLSNDFAQLLNRMLSPRPNNRYQSTTDVILALQGFIHTLAPAKKPTGSTIAKPRVTFTPAPKKPAPNPLNNPIVIAGGFVIAVIVGFGVLIKSNPTTSKTSSPTPSSPPNPSTTPSPVGSPSPTTTPSPVPTPTNSAFVKEGTIANNEPVNYNFNAQAGQRLSARVVSGEVAISVLKNQQLISSQVQGKQKWNWVLPEAGEYSIQFTLPPGISETTYKVEFALTTP
jgi:serine/threonine-protein kinase